MHPLETLHLGDLVQLPDGRQLTARARAMLPAPLGSMAGFVICGELEAMVSVPPRQGNKVLGYHPVADPPGDVRTARSVFHGACSYWAPHLPGQRQGMGELLYKVLEVPGSVDPVVLVWRGREVVIFVRGEAFESGLKVMYMPRDAEDLSDVDWRTSEVLPGQLVPDDPSQVPVPAERPAPGPVRTA